MFHRKGESIQLCMYLWRYKVRHSVGFVREFSVRTQTGPSKLAARVRDVELESNSPLTRG